jgi:hypothetical protein
MTVTLDPTDQVSVDSVIKESLEASELSDPHQIADQIIEEIPPDSFPELVRLYLIGRTRELIRNQRNRITGHETHSERWESVRADHESGALDIMRLRVAVGTEWKFLAELNRSDISTVIDSYRKRAQDNMDKATRYDQLKSKLIAANVETVGQLSPSEVRDALSS